MNYISKLQLDGSTAPIGSSLFGVCETEADEKIKVIDIPEFDEFADGTTIFVYFKYGNTYTNYDLTLQVGETSSWVARHMPAFGEYTLMSFTCGHFLDDVHFTWQPNESPTSIVTAYNHNSNIKGFANYFVLSPISITFVHQNG